MTSRLERMVRGWLMSARKWVPFANEGDPFNLKSSDALKDPEVRAALDKWKRGKMTTEEFRRWLDEKWESDHS